VTSTYLAHAQGNREVRLSPPYKNSGKRCLQTTA